MDDIKSKKNRMDTNEEFSDDDEEESMLSKLGGFLFFGCGNGKDKDKKSKM